jgi:hypothetical protein
LSCESPYIADEAIFRQIWKRAPIDTATFLIELTRHHALATECVQRVMEAADPGEQINKSESGAISPGLLTNCGSRRFS